MSSSLPSPATQTGLLSYYTFDNLLNKQGNPTWNGTLGGSAVINNHNPTCAAFVADSYRNIPSTPVNVVASFTAPDTVCTNTPVTVTNTSSGASSYYWNFCVTDINKTPTCVNMGNIGGPFSQPVFMDYVLVNNN